eukprot:363056-Prorocentrum_minimum.AAC.1
MVARNVNVNANVNFEGGEEQRGGAAEHGQWPKVVPPRRPRPPGHLAHREHPGGAPRRVRK